MKFNTPLRYPGGRDHLANFMKMIFVQNGLLGGQYVEPYAGSAGIALNLLTRGYVSCIHLNDVNPAIYAFWHSVIHQPEALCKAIHDVKITTEEWQRQKNILNAPENHSQLEVGFSIFLLNRINRLGILWRESIDGRTPMSHWNPDARFNKNDLIRRIEWIALHRSLIRLYHLDAADFIKTVLPTLPDKTLVYLDPPYDANERLLQEDHPSLQSTQRYIATLVKKHITQPWVASYHYTPEIIETYKGYPAITYSNAQNRHKGAEVIFFCKKLIIPSMNTPSTDLKIA